MRVATGLLQPVHVAAPSGDIDHLYIVEQPGRIRLLERGTPVAQPFLDIIDRVGCCDERGLLSLAFHPDYDRNGRFYVNYTERSGDVLISEFTATNPRFASPASERVLLRIAHRSFTNHNGGTVAFGRDRFLYVGVGDGGGFGDPFLAAQNRGLLLGKMLRLDVDGPSLVPPSNPFGNEVWGYGLRNPWRSSFDRDTGDLYIADVGQDRFEEIDFEPASSAGGRNWGWSLMEGRGHCFNDPNCNIQATELPVLEYANQGGACAIVGGHVYRGCALPDLEGLYLYGDFCAGFVRALRVSSGIVVEQRDLTVELGEVASLVSFGEDARGEIYVVSNLGTVDRIEPR